MTPTPVTYDALEKRFRDLKLRYSRSRKRIMYLALMTIVLFVVFMLCYLLRGKTNYFFDYELYFGSHPQKDPQPQKATYVVDTPNCRIVNHNPFTDDVELYKAQMNYSIDDHPGMCESLPLLSSISRSQRGHTLHLHKEHFIKHTTAVVTCCYSYIFSSALLFGEEENATVDEPKYMNCKKFDGDVKLDPDFDFVRVTCWDKGDYNPYTPASNVYKHFHSYVSIKREVIVKMDLYNETIRLGKKFENEPQVPPWEKPYSVMIIGLDSVSRLNLLRTMPKTVDYLEATGWYSLEGYNKVGESTFPNLAAAVLAGSTEEQLRRTCVPRTDTPVDWCHWVWGKFSSQGYITAYGEDNTKSDTFYGKAAGGFRHPPTDYFLRTLIKAADSFTTHDWYEKFIQYYDCIGKIHESEYIFDFSLEFTEVLQFYPTFSLFWLNSFSHERLFGPKPMDEYFRSYLQNLTALLNDTIVVLMSDHGMSHGFYRQTEMGFIENNLPFLYMWLPESFKMLNPKAVENLIENKHRLTSHFDLYMTLLDIVGDGSRALGCPKCRSLFQPVPLNRTCEDAGVPLRYCACTQYTTESNAKYRHLAEFLVSEINAIVEPLEKYLFEEFRCSNFSLKKINSLKRVVPKLKKWKIWSPQQNDTNGSQMEGFFVVSIETQPKALFEAMISMNGSMHIVDTILRLDDYESKSRCLENGTGRPYCVCEGKIDMTKKILDDEGDIDTQIKTSTEDPDPASPFL